MLPNKDELPVSQRSPTGHPLPRRTSPANSVTLRHHRLARDASVRANPSSAPAIPAFPKSTTRRNSSGDSHETGQTGQSDPKRWFDHSNQNPTAVFDNAAMDVDPPFFQKESQSSNEEKAFRFDSHLDPSKLTRAHSSSADDYRSVIDDLTIEIQKLKEELKRYKQLGPDILRKDKLFELKVHGLSSGKKRELEATLQNFASSLDGSQDASASYRRKKAMRQSAHNRMYSVSGSLSKHASSSTGSNFRPSDSAYASMSAGANSSGTSLGRMTTSSSSTKPSDRKTESGLQDIPEGLYPQRMVVTEREKKKLVVRRLEQIFTGKLGSRAMQKQAVPPLVATTPAAATTEATMQGQRVLHQPPSLPAEAAREAVILPRESRKGHLGRNHGSGDNGSASNSNGDIESGANEHSTGSSNDLSPPMPPPAEQRATRPRDLDPDRLQVPAENMDYIRHLGLVPPELLKQQRKSSQDVPRDQDGWVYLNLLCSMAQLHMINVTPHFVRGAVSEFSTKFDLSSDGRKIRWRGGTDGTHFSSDGSNYNSEKSPSSDDTDALDKDGRKRRKTGRSSGDDPRSGNSSKDASKSGPQNGTSSESWHYKPIFAHQGSPNGLTSMEDTISSLEPVGDGIVDGSRYGRSGSGSSGGKKRRRNGAIIYYSGAPFCTDLAGDPSDVSPVLELISTNKDPQRRFAPSPLRRTTSGSCITYKPLNDKGHLVQLSSEMEIDKLSDESSLSESQEDDDMSDIELDVSWSKTQQFLEFRTLEPCGIGGVLPDDHFIVVVATSRPKTESISLDNYSDQQAKMDENTDHIVSRFATMSTSPIFPWTSRTRSQSVPKFEIEYISGRIKRLTPVALPPPALLFPPFSSDCSSSEEIDDESDESDSKAFAVAKSSGVIHRRSDDYPDGVDLSSGDEEGEESEDYPDGYGISTGGNDKRQSSPSEQKDGSQLSDNVIAAAAMLRRGRSKSTDLVNRTDRSSVATAGGVESGYNSGEEDN